MKEADRQNDERRQDERIRGCLELAEGTGVFNTEEIGVLREVLEDAWYQPATSYEVIEENGDGKTEGFIIFGRTPMTAFTWDLYWIVVDKRIQGRGIGRKLLSLMEERLVAREKRAVIRVETSGKGAYEATRAFYQRTGFSLLGAIPDFYDEGDDLFIFYKTLRRS